jgi:hypothetical protein
VEIFFFHLEVFHTVVSFSGINESLQWGFNLWTNTMYVCGLDVANRRLIYDIQQRNGYKSTIERLKCYYLGFWGFRVGGSVHFFCIIGVWTGTSCLLWRSSTTRVIPPDSFALVIFQTGALTFCRGWPKTLIPLPTPPSSCVSTMPHASVCFSEGPFIFFN